MENVSTKILQHQRDEALEKEKALSEAIKEIEDLLINKKLTLGDWSKIIEHFNYLSERVVTSMSISELKKKSL